MRPLITTALATAALLPAAASAQSYGEVRRDQREVRQDRRDLEAARRYGDRRDVRDARQELREDRQETREDWRDYRRTHRDVYRRPAYVGPAGYRYRPVAPGYRFAPAYYGRGYWITDPWTYRLPRATAGRQWVRYGSDVVLVDLRSGRVIRSYDRFFW